MPRTASIADDLFCCRCSARLLLLGRFVERRFPPVLRDFIHLPTCPGETAKGLCARTARPSRGQLSPGIERTEDMRFVAPTEAMVEERRRMFGESW
jgi:hypothetical protein